MRTIVNVLNGNDVRARIIFYRLLISHHGRIVSVRLDSLALKSPADSSSRRRRTSAKIDRETIAGPLMNI